MAKPKPQADPNNKTEPVEDAPSAEDELQIDAADIELSEEAAQLVLNLQSQIDEAVAARQRALADFRNYQKRAAESEIPSCTHGGELRASNRAVVIMPESISTQSPIRQPRKSRRTESRSKDA